MTQKDTTGMLTLVEFLAMLGTSCNGVISIRRQDVEGLGMAYPTRDGDWIARINGGGKHDAKR